MNVMLHQQCFSAKTFGKNLKQNLQDKLNKLDYELGYELRHNSSVNCRTPHEKFLRLIPRNLGGYLLNLKKV